MQCRQRAPRLADVRPLDQVFRSNRFFRGYVSQSVRACPDNLSVVEKRDAYARNFVEVHALAEGHCEKRLALDDNSWRQIVFDTSDTSRSAFVLSLLRMPGSASANSRGLAAGLHQGVGKCEKCDGQNDYL